MGRGKMVEKLIIGDHIEAIHYAMERQGERLHLHDQLRQRQAARSAAKSGGPIVAKRLLMNHKNKR
jgi:hypothetical protein